MHKQQGRCNRRRSRKAEEREERFRRNFWIQEDFNRVGKLMSRISIV
jgi:hypothetical protein